MQMTKNKQQERLQYENNIPYDKNQTMETKKIRINNKRKIRKMILRISYDQLSVPLTKDQKKIIQKAKNRQSASKFRQKRKKQQEQLKQNVQQLKKQNKRLNQQNSNLRLEKQNLQQTIKKYKFENLQLTKSKLCSNYTNLTQNNFQEENANSQNILQCIYDKTLDQPIKTQIQTQQSKKQDQNQWIVKNMSKPFKFGFFFIGFFLISCFLVVQISQSPYSLISIKQQERILQEKLSQQSSQINETNQSLNGRNQYFSKSSQHPKYYQKISSNFVQDDNKIQQSEVAKRDKQDSLQQSEGIIEKIFKISSMKCPLIVKAEHLTRQNNIEQNQFQNTLIN